MQTIYFLLFPKVHILDLACPAQVFYEANQFGGPKFRICYVGLNQTVENEQAGAFGKVALVSEVEITRHDIICIPGVDFKSFREGMLDEAIDDLAPVIHKHLADMGVVMSICTGSLILARMGVLDGKSCSTHWKCFDYFKDTFPRAILQEQNLFSRDSGIYTSAGMTTGIDMTLAYLEEAYDPLLAAYVARELVINVRREHIGDQKNTFLNFKNRFHPVVYQVQQILESRIGEIVSVGQLAAELSMSERNLNRLFKKHMGMGIAVYRNNLKMKEAGKLLRYSEMSVKEIARHLGYATENYFIRVWKEHYKVAPGRYRQQMKVSEEI